MQVILPPEPVITFEAYGLVSKMEGNKYGKKYEKVKKEIKQVYSIYCRQCDEEITSSLSENPSFM